MSNRFFFDEDDSAASLSDLDADNDSSLPFPKPLDRSSFLTPEFDAATFLSSLSNRFQTLEDLQDELRELSQSLSKELVDLVNDNYQDFLALGNTLAGGEEKVEEVRVGLLGFQRDVGGVRDKVVSRKSEVAQLLQQKKALRKEIAKGRNLLQVDERLDELEQRFKWSTPTSIVAQDDSEGGNTDTVWSEDWDNDVAADSDGELDQDTGISSRLLSNVEQYKIVRLLMRKHDAQHPFLVSQKERIARLHEALRVDLESAIRQETDVRVKQKIIALRSSLDD